MPFSQRKVLPGSGRSIAGVGFRDIIHGRQLVAPNGMELHAVLSFAGTCTRPPMDYSDIGGRIVAAIGESRASELLDLLPDPTPIATR